VVSIKGGFTPLKQFLMPRAVDVALLMRWMNIGGAERVTANVATGLSQAGLNVDLVLVNAQGPYLADLPASIEIIDLAVIAYNAIGKFQLPMGLQAVRSLLKLVAYLKAHKPKVLLSATHYLNEIAIIAKYLAGVSTRVMVAEHTTLSIEANHAEPRSAKFIPLTSRILYPFADSIIAVSQGVAQDLSIATGLALNSIEVLYNPVISALLYQQAEVAVEHHWFNDPSIPVLVGIGRLVRQKDFSTLLKAFAQARQHQLLRLVLLGDGPDRHALEVLADTLGVASDVWFAGNVANPYAYLSKASLFVSSSAWEGLPTVLIEAMALKCPIVATDCPSGPAEILNQGKYGELVSIGNVTAMAAAIRRTLQNPPKLIPANHIEQFTREAAIARYLQVLQCNLGLNQPTQPLMESVPCHL
jgi:glycosyltransferase involved in cell wall biosynthesis